MKATFAVILMVAMPAFAQDASIATIAPHAWGCVSKETFDASLDYLMHKEHALFGKMLSGKNAPCMPLKEGQKVVVRSRSWSDTVIRPVGTEILLHTNPGAFK